MNTVVRVVTGSFLLATLVSSASGQSPAPGKAIALRQGAPTHAAYCKAHLAFCLRELDLYDQNTADPQAARSAARNFLRSSLSRHTGQLESEDPQATEWKKLAESGHQVVEKLGSTDPLVSMHYIDALLDAGQLERASKVAEGLPATFDQTGYPSGMRLMILSRVLRTELRVGDPTRLATARFDLYLAVPSWFRFASRWPDSQRIAWNEFTSDLDGFSSQAAKQALDELEKQTSKDPWLWEMLQGKYHYDLAWHARGQGPVHALPLPKWQQYVAEMKLAGQHYRQAHELNPSYPEAATAMIAVAKEGHDLDSTWDWFQRAIAAEVDHMPAYEAMLASLQPRWGGSIREMFAFGESCVQTNRYDTVIPYVYILAALQVHAETGSWQTVFEEPRLYDKTSYVLARMVDHPTRVGKDHLSYVQAELLTQSLGFAVHGDRFAEAGRIWNRLGERAVEKWLIRFGLGEEYDRSRIAAYAEHGEALLSLRPLTMPPRSDPEKTRRLLDGYQKLLAKNRDPKARPYLQHWVDLAQMEVDYHAGKWVNLTFENSLAHWMGDRPFWKAEDERTAVGSNAGTGQPLSLYHEGEFAGPKEIRGEAELVRAVSPGMMFGFYVGMPAEGLVFAIDPKSGHASVATPGQPVQGGRMELHGPTALRIVIQAPNRFDFFINDQRYGGDTQGQQIDMASNRIGMGTLWWARMAGEIRFKNVQVRKLVEPAPAAATPDRSSR